MREDPGKFIDKVVYSILATIGIVLVKFMGDLNKNTSDLTLELSKLNQKIEYHDAQLKKLSDSDITVFRIETELGMHEKRLSLLERKLR